MPLYLKVKRIRGDRSIYFSLIAKLREKCKDRHYSDLDVEVPDAPDPMDEMNVTEEEPVRKIGKTKAEHYVFRPHIYQVKMPVSPPEALGPVVERVVRVYVGQYNVLWVHEEDIEWLLRYMFVQHQLKGVPSVHDDDVGPGGPPPCPCESLSPTAAGSSTVGCAIRDWDSLP